MFISNLWSRGDPAAQDPEIYTARADGSDRRRLTHLGESGVPVSEPCFSPDGRFIAYQRSVTISVMAANGEDDRQITGPRQTAVWPDWGRRTQ